MAEVTEIVVESIKSLDRKNNTERDGAAQRLSLPYEHKSETLDRRLLNEARSCAFSTTIGEV